MNFTTEFFDKKLNYEQLLKKYPQIQMVSQKQIHSSKVTIIKTAEDIHKINVDKIEADALVTNLPNIGLVVHTADCLPVLGFDSQRKIIGACHAGWRGVSLGILENWIGAFTDLGAKKENLKIEIGPAIGSCHFEVGKDVAQTLCTIDATPIPKEIAKQAQLPHPNPEKSFINLKVLAGYHLQKAGIKSAQITTSDTCTFCNENFNSYRREGPKQGRNESLIYRL